MYKAWDVQRKEIFLFMMICFLIVLLVGCGQESSVYNGLSDADKHIVEIVCGNSEQFVNTEVDMQAIRFVNWNGNMYFLVQDCEKGKNAYVQTAEQWYIIRDDALVETDDYDYLFSSWSGTV